MGLQVDLSKMLDLPLKHECPKCKRTIDTHLDDFDLESPSINPRRGEWKLGFYCPNCEHEWKVTYKIAAVPINP